ncbi:MAG: transglycosylase SLT domain-containing protein [Bacteroidales bacterium]|jgi:membrane-bound lytic murein transglycosylase D|nr:transglycosylase SLT domain-containing protein [Bacteroidales bacterium]MDD4702904.1 transglycosylase SLT domain-containing protein [Bacteroidales bacterium]MDX9797573.1 transglycosylase SLT domain-containing protein [Bacteroidales bacterium]
MYKTKKLKLLIIILLLPFVSFSQKESELNVIRNFESNFDSLLTSFYIKQNTRVTKANYEKASDNLCPPTSVSNVSDSIIAKRLSALPSAIELTYNKQVRNIIEYYIDKGGARVGVMLGLSKYYFPIFEAILDEYSVPHELKYLVVIESALNPNAVSRAGATGLWQFMYSTGRMYDLRINANVDDRKDPLKSTVAAARYLKDLHRIYGDWQLALAAYNCGPGNVNKAIRRSGKRDFWGIYNFLPRETRGYVPAYIAACYVMNYYKEHNITPAVLSKPIATDTVKVRRDIHFEQIASVLDISTDQIKDLNPQYKRDLIYGTQDNYSLKLPFRYINTFISLEDSIAEYEKEKYFGPNWEEKEYITKEVKLTHKVRKGETWSSIARRYGVSVNNLRRWNGNKKVLQRGKVLSIYKTQKVEVTKKDKEESSPFTEQTTVSNEEVVQTNSKQVTEKPKENKPKAQYHKVKKGETISSISRKYNVPMDDIFKLNNMNRKRSIIKIGQNLRVR